MTNFRNITELEKHLENMTTSYLVDSCNGVATLNYKSTDNKENVKSQFEAVKAQFPKAQLKGRKYMKIEVPYNYITKEQKLAESLYGYSFQA